MSDPIYLVSDSADFDPVDHPGLITWTFAASPNTGVAAGLYELRFVRPLNPEEYDRLPVVLGVKS